MEKKQDTSMRIPYDSPVSEVLVIRLEECCLSTGSNESYNEKPYIIGSPTEF